MYFSYYYKNSWLVVEQFLDKCCVLEVALLLFIEEFCVNVCIDKL